MSISTNAAAVASELIRMSEAAKAEAIRATDDFGEHVLGDAQQLCPIDTGYLKASGNTEPAEVNDGKVTKKVSFNASYAAVVHERLDVHHPQGQAKYLETAVRNNQPKFAPYVLDRVKKVL